MQDLELLTTAQAATWTKRVTAHQSVFASLPFAAIQEEFSGHTARLLAAPDLGVVYPFLLQQVDLAGLGIDADEGPYYDIASPPYTGPLVGPAGEPPADPRFSERLTELCRREGIVAEFAHLHPWDTRPALLDASCTRDDREIVYVDLTRPLDDLWHQSLSYACRKNIRRAERENVRVFQATTAAEIREFHRIYTQTMDAREAQPHYYLPLSYFAALHERMPDHACFILAEYAGQTISGTLYLHDDTDVYSYLGGTDREFQHVRPTNAVVYEAIRWGHLAGKKRLVLGGGYRPGDGILRFKASFSPLRALFRTYRRVHLADVYARLCRAWSARYHCPVSPDGFFPAYRAVPARRGA